MSMRWLLAGLLFLPGIAAAHGGFGQGTPFYSGMLHVLLGVQFVLPLVAVALLASQRGEGTMPRAQLVLGAAVGVGAVIGLTGLDLGLVTQANRVLAIVAGVLVALGLGLSERTVLALLAAVGMFCGYELLRLDAPDSAVVWFVGGVMGGAMIVQGAVAILAVAARAEWARVGVRVVGSWVGATGLIYLGFAVA